MEAELPIILKTYDLYKKLVECNVTLPKLHRYGLGQSAEQTILSTIEQLVMAKYAPKPTKAKYLIHTTAHIETLRFKLRLYLELQLVNETRIFQMQADVQEIARMTTGWRKSVGA
jgi:ADP-dependent phosphofructokinase/glucokinase